MIAPELQAEIFSLAHRGLKRSEIANRVGVSKNTVTSTLRRGGVKLPARSIEDNEIMKPCLICTFRRNRACVECRAERKRRSTLLFRWLEREKNQNIGGSLFDRLMQ